MTSSWLFSIEAGEMGRQKIQQNLEKNHGNKPRRRWKTCFWEAPVFFTLLPYHAVVGCFLYAINVCKKYASINNNCQLLLVTTDVSSGKGVKTCPNNLLAQDGRCRRLVGAVVSISGWHSGWQSASEPRKKPSYFPWNTMKCWLFNRASL